MVVLPEDPDYVSIECSDLLPTSSPGSSVVLVGEDTAPGADQAEAMIVSGIDEDRNVFNDWLETQDRVPMKRRRFWSDPTALNLTGTGLTEPVLLTTDRLSDLVGVERALEWCDNDYLDYSSPSAPNLLAGWNIDQESLSERPSEDITSASDVTTSTSDVTTSSSAASSGDRRVTYTDELLHRVFKDIMDTMGAYNAKVDQLSQISRLVEQNEENEQLKVNSPMIFNPIQIGHLTNIDRHIVDQKFCSCYSLLYYLTSPSNCPEKGVHVRVAL